MLEDPRAQAFVEDFTNGWLSLNKLGAMAPDLRKFPGYYDNDLEPAMRMETRLFSASCCAPMAPSSASSIPITHSSTGSWAQLYGLDPRLVEAAQGKAVEGLSAADLLPDAGGNAPSLGFARVVLADPTAVGCWDRPAS